MGQLGPGGSDGRAQRLRGLVRALQHRGIGVLDAVLGRNGLVLDNLASCIQLRDRRLDPGLGIIGLIGGQGLHPRDKRVDLGLDGLHIGPGGVFRLGNVAADLLVKLLRVMAREFQNGLR